MINYSSPIKGQRLSWDSNKTFKIAWRKFKAELIDYLILLTKHSTEDELGIVWSIFEANTFEDLFGHARIILVDPGPIANNATPAAIENNRTLKTAFAKQQEALTSSRMLIESLIPASLLNPMKILHSLRTITTEQIVTRLEGELGTII